MVLLKRLLPNRNRMIRFPLDFTSPRLLDGLTPTQMKAVTSPYRFSLVVAGPGSGKTLSLVRRAAYMVERGIPPSQMALITFTRKAAEEMESRLFALLGEVPIFIGTFHSYALFLLRSGAGESRDILDEEGSLALFQKAIKDVGAEGVSFLDIQRRLGAGISLKGTLRKVYERYQQLKEEAGKWDFDDLIVEVTKNPKVTLALRPHVLVDEYQDLNWPQLRLLKLGAQLPGGTVFAVGDPRQAIYGWRGSDVEIFLRFPQDFPGAEIFALKENHRSHRGIVVYANSFIQRETAGLKGVEAFFPPQIPLSTEEGEVKIVRTPSLEEDIREGAHLAREWVSLHGEGGVAILLRGRKAKGLNLKGMLSETLASLGVPEGDGRPIRELSEFATVTTLLEYSLFPNDKSLLKLLATSLPREVRKFLRRSHERGRLPLGMEEAYTLGGRAFKSLWDSVREGQDLLPILTSPEIVEAFSPEGEGKALTLAFLRVLTQIYSESEPGNPLDFLNLLWERSGTAVEGVTVSTVHAAKGLEWPAVIVVGVRDGVLPSWSSPRMEEAFLFYVAATRAKERMALIGGGSFL